MANKDPKFYITLENSEVVVIRDSMAPGDNCLSVTNGAEVVVKKLSPVLGDRKLFYYDTENELSEMVVENGEFKEFNLSPDTSLM